MGKPIIETLRELSEKFKEEGEWTHGAAIDETCGVLGIKQNPWWAVDYSQILAFIADKIDAEYVQKKEPKLGNAENPQKQPVRDGKLPIMVEVPFTAATAEWADSFVEKVKAGKISIEFFEVG